MNGRRLGLAIAIVMLFSMAVGATGVTARELLPPAPERPQALEGQILAGNPYQPQRDADGRWVVPGDRLSEALPGVLSMATSGGPDDFGYTWDDTVALNWIDASGGVNVNFDETIDVGFEVKFYENIYQYINVSMYGYMTFSPNTDNWQSQVPSPEIPNDVIAPHWVPVDQIGGYIRYLKGGTVPNRWFVVEWNRVQNDVYDPDEMDEFTFQAILHENGDIVFQYQTMVVRSGYSCMASGIEDSTGLDGLGITSFCSPVASNHAVKITRPVPAARVRIWPRHQGQFTQPGQLVSFQVPVRNTGELGADTYDILLNTLGWPVSVFGADGNTLLVDTDADGVLDTGPVAQGSTVTLTVKVQAPNPVNVGDSNLVMLTATSSLDPTKSKTANLQNSVPAPFAQAYMDNALGSRDVYLAQPASQDLEKVTPGDYYGWNGALAEAPNGNLVNVWQKGRCLDQNCDLYGYELEYAILDHAGNVIRQAGKLTDLSGAANNIYDEDPAIAIAPDGKIGVIWRRVTYNSDWESNYNLHLAILDAAGNPSAIQTNLTNNTLWGYADGVPRYYDPRITATGDNRFAMAWNTYTYLNGSVYDIYYAIRDTQNNPIAAAKFTNDTPDYSQHYRYPTVSALDNNRLLLAYSHNLNYTYSTAYAVLDSSGNVVFPQSLIPVESYNLDAIQLSDGKVILAWSTWTGFYPGINYAILDGSTYALSSGPQVLDNPLSLVGDDYVSVTADRSGRAILTWTDPDFNYRPNLYYATIGGNGAVLTPPTIFRTAELSGSGMQYLDVHLGGYANTSYTIAPTTPQVDAYIKSAALIGASPEGNAAIPIEFGNLGATTATSLVITATLDSALSYVGNSLGIAPVINGSELTWNIPTPLAFLGAGQFQLWVQTPDTDYGTRYPVSFEIASDGVDGVAANNVANLQVMVARLISLPLVMGR